MNIKQASLVSLSLFLKEMLNVQPNKEENLVERKRETPLEKVEKEVDGDVASGGSSNVPPATPEISSSCHFFLLVGAGAATQ